MPQRNTVMPASTGSAHRVVAGAVFAAAFMASAFAADATTAPPKAVKSPGVPVQVSAEMTGAGIVSSGVELPPIPPLTGNRKVPVPSWGKPLPYPIVIADRRNNRLIEVTPDKRIVWEFPSPNLLLYRGNEDVNFSADGRVLAVSEEDNYDVHIVDYEQKVITWTYGVPDTRGSKGNLLNYPDDAHLLADGMFLTADIRNCRVLIIDPRDSKITTQWGQPGQCRHDPPRQLAHPNGATPMDNGDILVSEITEAWISRLTRQGQLLWSVRAPHVRYPSDAFPTVDGKQVIVADFSKPGRVVIFDPATGKPSWEYFAAEGEQMLDHPSLARELPDTGDILVVDDLRDRVVVIDRKTKAFIWQYGVTGVKGHAPGYLNYPDGLDLDVYRDWKSVRQRPSRRDRRRVSARPVRYARRRRRAPHGIDQGHDQVHRQRKDDGRILVGGDHRQRLQIAQLHRLRLRGQDLGGLRQLLGGLQFTLGVDHLGAPFALGLGLAGDGANHRFIEVDMLDLDIGHLDTPGIGLAVEDFLQGQVQALALGQHFVQRMPAEHGAQGGLRELAGGHQEVLDLDHRALRVDDAKVQHRVDLERHVVARDHVLARHVHDHDAQVDAHHLLDAGNRGSPGPGP